MNTNIFINDVVILNQSIRGIHYTTQFGEDVNFTDPYNLNLSISYDVFTHKKNNRDHLVVLELTTRDENDQEDSNGNNQFQIIVEGHYLVSDLVDNDQVDQAKHFGSLSNLLSFLRTSVHTITSMTMGGTFHLPLISIEELHKDYLDKTAKKVSTKKR